MSAIRDLTISRGVFPYWKNHQVVYFAARKTAKTPQVDWENPKHKKLLTHERHDHVSSAVGNDWFVGVDSISSSPDLLITEGITDCYAAIQANLACISPATVVFREKDYPKLENLAAKAKQVYICNDSEESNAGTKGSIKTADYLGKKGICVKLVQLPRQEGVEKVDLADYLMENGVQRFRQLMDEAKTLLQLELDKLTVSFDMDIYQSVISRIALLNEVERDIQTGRLHQILKPMHIRKSTIEEDIERVQKQKEIASPNVVVAEDNSAAFDSEYYAVVRDRICVRKNTQDGVILKPLANFTAEIIKEEIHDDGIDRNSYFTMKGKLADGSPLPEIAVSSKNFSSMNWPMEHWGNRAIVYAGATTKDHLRVAIQMLSKDVFRQTIYSHVGWRFIDGQWLYLHSAGAIGPSGFQPAVHVQVGDRLQYASLPEPPIGADLHKAVRASISFLELAPITITLPLLSAIYRAPLGECCVNDLSVFVVGPTGTQKTELTAMAQAHFGSEFNGRNLPGNWLTTGNALEYQAFLMKDMVFTVDDFAPTGTTADVQRLHKQADRLMRGQGNRAGRGRLRADGLPLPLYFSRGLILSSGEDIPRGQSLRGRMVILEVSPGYVDLAGLTQVQEFAGNGLLAQSMAGYIQWLAPRIEDLKSALPQQQRDFRSKAQAKLSGHARTPDSVASLTIGWNTFLNFAYEVGAISHAEQAELRNDGWAALMDAAQSQSVFQGTEDPVDCFIALLKAALTSGHGHLLDGETGEAPVDATRWGWRTSGVNSTGHSFPKGDCIGWVSGTDLYLQPDAVFRVVKKYASDQGESLGVTQQTLWKRMRERGLLASYEKGRNLNRFCIGGIRESVVHLDVGIIS